MNWRDFSGAPAPGALLAATCDLPAGETLTLMVGDYPVLLARGAAGLRAFVNACPHQYLPLDQRGDRVISADGRILRCTNHDAGFDAGTGVGLDGHGLGCALTPIPVEEWDGGIHIAG